MRTQNAYEHDLTIMDETNEPHRGIKKQSIFNELNHFSLFNYGLPPCYGHDLFLGCFSYDIVLIFCRFVKKKLIGENYLKSRINYLLKKMSLNSQITLNLKKKCVTSKATDLWHLIMILPLVFMKTERVYSDKSFDLLILLKQITDIVAAPIVSLRQIATLRLSINNYLQMRTSLFEAALRPKHHYLSHYPHLILQFGPLHVFSTMRGERKHSFFKNALRHAGNYKNILKLCSERHQYYQAMLGTKGNRFEQKISFINFVYEYQFLDEDEKQLIDSFGMNASCFKYSDSVNYNGTLYKSNDCLVLESDEFDDYFVLKITGIIFNSTSREISVYGRKLKVIQMINHGLSILENNIDGNEEIICQHFDSFDDLTPLQLYKCDNYTYVFHKHAIPLH